jgi:hypothetical protein
MNTEHKGTEVRQGRHCDHTFMVAGDAVIRLAQPRRPAIDPFNGKVITSACPVPRCEEAR